VAEFGEIPVNGWTIRRNAGSREKLRLSRPHLHAPLGIVEFSTVTQNPKTTHNAGMPILLIVLIVLIVLSFGGGVSRPQYRRHGISVGTILLIVLVLWLLGVFGSRPF
jgi:hypothetical protein